MRYYHLHKLATLTVFLLFAHNAALHAQHRNAEYNMLQGQMGQLSGKVTYDGSPMDGVRVILSYKGDGVAEAITGTDGAYIFKELNPDKYTLSFFKDGYRKRIVNEIPVVETYTSSSEIVLHKLNNRHDENHPLELTFEELKHHNIEKIR